MKRLLRLLLAFCLVSAGCGKRDSNESANVVRFGHFPNITHVQALVAHNLSRQGKGWFEQYLGPGVEVQWFIYNAGPSAMEALFARTVDFTYVGPSPALNAYSRARGEDIRIIAGAANGGAALVIQSDSRLQKPADFRGRKIATPQFGNTQDVSARAWLKSGGLKITQRGGDAMVLPTANPDQITLFQQKQLDGVWTVEPWVSRLELEAGGKVLVEEPEANTTVLVTNTKIIKQKPELAQKIAKAHRELTAWIQQNPEEAQKLVRDELSTLMKSDISMDLVRHAWPRIILTDTITRTELDKFVAAARDAGFLTNAPDLGRLIVSP